MLSGVLARWMTAFLDTPRHAPRAAEAVDFWQRVTGTRPSSRRGEREQFATLLPPEGDAYLRTQEAEAGPAGCHLDLHVEDVHAAAAEAVDQHADLVADLGTLVVARSPAGLTFCLVQHQGERHRPTPLVAADGSTSLVDQLCIDVAPASFDTEVRWWSTLLGWPTRRGVRSESAYLERPPQMPLRLLLQRLEDPGAALAGSHLDLACSDRAAEVARHLGYGAAHRRHEQHWDTLDDPAGRSYCLTDRDPASGRLAAS